MASRSFYGRRARPLLFVLVLLMAVAAPVLGQMETANPPLKISVGAQAPDFALPATDGQTVRLSSLAGHTVLIDFYRGYY
jgi:cytochrome oxidase Cu insertion factor (SCO1/SenC/PrrC family)